MFPVNDMGYVPLYLFLYRYVNWHGVASIQGEKKKQSKKK